MKPMWQYFWSEPFARTGGVQQQTAQAQQPCAQHDFFFKSALNPFNSQDLISNSPYCLLYSSCNVSLENLVLDQLIIP